MKEQSTTKREMAKISSTLQLSRKLKRLYLVFNTPKHPPMLPLQWSVARPAGLGRSLGVRRFLPGSMRATFANSALSEKADSHQRSERFKKFQDELKQIDDADLDDFILGNTNEVRKRTNNTNKKKKKKLRKPAWLKAPEFDDSPDSDYMRLKKTVKSLNIATVCEEAKCPNIGK
jgi:hypothetical protein